MGLTKQQRAYLKAQKQAFKLHNSIFGYFSFEGVKDVEEEVEEGVIEPEKYFVEMRDGTKIRIEKPLNYENPDEVVTSKQEQDFKKDFGDFFKPYCTHSTLTKEALENLTNPLKNGRNK